MGRTTFRRCKQCHKIVTVEAWYRCNAAPDNHSDTMEAPMITRPLPVYNSIITGEEIDGRTQHREHLKRHDAEEVGNEKTWASDKPKMRDAALDVKDAIEQIKAGTHDPRPVETISGDVSADDTRMYQGS